MASRRSTRDRFSIKRDAISAHRPTRQHNPLRARQLREHCPMACWYMLLVLIFKHTRDTWWVWLNLARCVQACYARVPVIHGVCAAVCGLSDECVCIYIDFIEQHFTHVITGAHFTRDWPLSALSAALTRGRDVTSDVLGGQVHMVARSASCAQKRPRQSAFFFWLCCALKLGQYWLTKICKTSKLMGSAMAERIERNKIYNLASHLYTKKQMAKCMIIYL